MKARVETKVRVETSNLNPTTTETATMNLTTEQRANAIVKLAAVHRNTKVSAAKIAAVTLVIKVADNKLTDTDVRDLANLLEAYAPKRTEKYVRPSIVRQKLFARELEYVEKQAA